MVWAAAYVAIAWAAVKLVDSLTEPWTWSGLQQAVSLVLAIAILPTLLCAAICGEPRKKEIGSLEAAILAATIMGVAFTVWSICFTLVAS